MAKSIKVACECECEGTGFVAVPDIGGEGVEHVECGTHHPSYQSEPTVCDYGANPSVKAFECMTEEQCDDCWMVDHLKECSGCEHYDHPEKLIIMDRVRTSDGLVGKVVEFDDGDSVCVGIHTIDGYSRRWYGRHELTKLTN